MSAELDRLLKKSGKSNPDLHAVDFGETARHLDLIRHIVLTSGLQDQPGAPSQYKHSQRSLLWKLLLRLPATLHPESYIALVSYAEPSPACEKIRNDAFRTLATDQEFRDKVGEDRLIRLLDAYVWRASFHQHLGISYVQGMNVLAAPFLYTLNSELEAWHCFTRFIEFCCPLYVQPTLEGVHRGLKLLDRCLAVVDRELFQHLRSKNLTAELYAFPSVMTFSACTPPLKEVLHVFDFLLAYGCHLNILIVIAQLYLMRDQLLASSSPMALLRTFPPLAARQCIVLACGFLAELPEPLYSDLARHPYDDSLVLD